MGRWEIWTLLAASILTFLALDVNAGVWISTAAMVCLLVLNELVHRRRAARELLQSHLQLGESEARFRSLAESLPQIVWTASPDGSVDYFNDRWIAYTGLPRQKSLGFAWIDSLHPDDREPWRESWRRASAAGTPFQIECRLRRNDGLHRWFLTLAVPQRDERGEVVRWFGSCTDIDDRRRGEEEKQRSLDRFRALMEALPRMVWTAKPSGEVDYYNLRWVNFTGLTLEMTRDSGWTRALHPDDRARAAEEWRESVASGNSFTLESRVKEEVTGKYRWHLISAMPVLDPEHRMVEWVATLVDIHDRKLHAETLERVVRERTTALSATNAALLVEIEERKRAVARELAAAAELRRSNQELEQFAYVASHDLQEPLRMIQAFGDRLRCKFENALGDQGKEYIKRMLSSAERMRALIDDLLSLSRVTTQARAFVPVDLNVVAAEVLADFEERIAQTGAEVRVETLPTLEADPFQMRQLLQNLIGNALKFHHPEAPPRIVVEAAASPSSECLPEQIRWRLSVTDNGIGFDDAHSERIFQVFQRLHGRSEYDGTGIGLAVCRKIVERHHGTVTAHGRPGEGATFVVELPDRQPTAKV